MLLDTLHTLGPLLASSAPTRLDALLKLVGRLHVATVHFPIALLIAAALFEFLRSRRNAPGPSPAALRCLVLGALAALAAAAMGWLNAAQDLAGASASGGGAGGGGWGGEGLVVSWHRWLGVAASALAVLTVLVALPAVWKPDGRAFPLYRLLLVVSAALVGLTGHYGGRLTHGDDYLAAPISALFRGPAVASPPPPPPANSDTLEARAVAILEHSCTACHGRGKTKGGLSLISRETALRGGKHGPSITPGQPDVSELIARLVSDDPDLIMPADADPLPPEQIDTLRQWIREGARWPEPAAGSGSASADAPHWSYSPIARSAPPALPPELADWARNPVDAFIAARLVREGLKPSPPADRATLIRRVTLDLTGLPPAIAEVDDFLADTRPDAYERVVDRLLASPRYGERWATWWLDLARYADSHGYEKDTARSMWPYRDWVIDALNDDLPFDRFTTEQLAGDLLPEPTTAQLVATAFNRNTMINEEGGADPEEYRVAAVADRVNTTATVWLGTTMSCAQCHDHKYDPFTIADYYRLFAFFNNTPDETRQLPNADIQVIGRTLSLPEPRRAEWEQDLAAAQQELARLPDKKSPEHESVHARVERLRSLIASIPTVQVMAELSPPRSTHLLEGGSFLSPGAQVSPGTPESLPPMGDDLPRNRLGLARWIMDPRNPLTARVTVNRVWAAHFGAGLVATDEDFGTRGERPSHPELLDHLAADFRDHGWSLKRLHRTIVTSRTYQQSSVVTPDLLERDPANRLLARAPRSRLDAEMIRDQALAIGGLLSPKMHGPGVFPRQSPGIWSNPYVADRWIDSVGEDAHRRSIYTFWKRSTPYPTFVSFDAPQRTVSCTRRPRTNTPLQALTTLNDPVFMEAAAGLARRTLSEAGPSADQRAAFAFRACLARPPTPDELHRLAEFLRIQHGSFAASPESAHALVAAFSPGENLDDPRAVELASWTMLANVLLNLDELLTRG